jgi:hypothetical protein
MPSDLASIEVGLALVQQLRQRRAAEPALAAKVEAIKRYQHARLQRDYIGWLADPRYRSAARFFLDHLYGPHDFSARDAQFARIIPALKRLLPQDLKGTVVALIELHALTESMDQAMAEQLASADLDEAAYRSAWRRVGLAPEREHQVALMLDIGRSLDRHTRRTVVGATLRLMRRPAHAAGLGELQEFLERGFDAFKAMNGAEVFLQTVAQNERAQIAALFSP